LVLTLVKTHQVLVNQISLVAGYSATNAVYSNFIGYYAGYSATNASNSNFGVSAGNEATMLNHHLWS
jgi:hypothetical protein